jgi:Asp/Glu/hydantoin racemase
MALSKHTETRPRIVLVHAVRVAMQPIEDAFRADWPEAERVNLLDDSLGVDRAKARDLQPAMFERFRTLTDYAETIGAAGLLFTCSAFGPAIEAARAGRAFPVLKPNEAMFEDALARGARVGMVATFEPSIAPMAEEFRALAEVRRPEAELRSIFVADAMNALNAGDGERHDRLIGARVAELADCDVVLLAQFSTARAAPAVSAALKCPVLTSPRSAVGRLKAAIIGPSPD